MNVIEELEKQEVARLLGGKKIPYFQAGDTVRVNVRIKEGERERIHRRTYERACAVARSGGGLQENFTVRKISFGEGDMPSASSRVLSPMIESIEVKRAKRRSCAGPSSISW